MVAPGHPVLHPDKLRFFSAEQYDAPCFRFQPFDPTADIGWVKVLSSCHSRAELWVPAQLVLVGYAPRRHEGEPWMMPAVTTGSAAHTDETLALAQCAARADPTRRRHGALVHRRQGAAHRPRRADAAAREGDRTPLPQGSRAAAVLLAAQQGPGRPDRRVRALRRRPRDPGRGGRAGIGRRSRVRDIQGAP